MARSRKKVKKYSLTSFAIKGVFFVMLASMVLTFANNQIEISAREKELAMVQEKLEEQIANNEALEQILQGTQTEIVEGVARNSYDYIAPDERVFIDMSGK